MFKLTPNPTFAATVSVPLPEGTGTAERQTAALPLTFRHKGRDALDDWIGRPAQMRAAGTPIDDATYLAEVIAGWGAEVTGEDGQPAAFSESTLRQLLNSYPTAAVAIYDTYLTALTDAKAKT